MRPSGEQYRLLVEHSPVMLWRAGRDAKCDYFNETWLRFTGRSLEDELGEGWATGVHPDDLSRCLRHYRTHFELRAPFEMVYQLRRADGAYRYVFDRGVPFTDEAGEFAGFIGSCVDVHDREVADRGKAAFLATMAHEQRTPLSAMKMFVSSLACRARHGQPLTEELFGRLHAQIDRFARLVDVLSETARLEEGRQPTLQRELLDLRELVARVVGFRPESIDGHGGSPKHLIAFDDGGRPCAVMGDPLRLEQVFINLLDNAVKYSPAGGVIRVMLRTHRTHHEVVVADPGIGIPSSELPALFGRYYRASNVSPDHLPGLGLGLSVCKELLEQHGGRLDIESVLSHGTTVRVQLPSADRGP